MVLKSIIFDSSPLEAVVVLKGLVLDNFHFWGDFESLFWRV